MAPPTDAADSPAALVECARTTLADVYSFSKHQTACALRTTDGTVHTGVHLGTTLGTAGVHAEAAALADACEGGHDEVDVVAAVSYVPDDAADADHGKGPAAVDRDAVRSAPVIPPCGTCRELLYDYGPNADVVVAGDPVETRPLADLLPDVPWHTDW